MDAAVTPVALITPPSPFLADQKVFLSLGILKVAAVLEARGYPVQVIDLSGVTNFEDAAAEQLVDSGARTVGITATSPQMPAVRRIVDRLRATGPYRVILGGPHPTLVHASIRRGRVRANPAWATLLEMADVIVAGDGEDAIFAALEPDAPPVIDADDPKGPWFLTSARLDETPWPARHLVDLDSYHYTIDGERAASMIAQLGCPMPCNFCSGRSSPML
ncbi:MAG: cobalamin-dependent protein, partial [Gemmatimonadales bacterium]|nr:cobalamin-dependent protein [Gemmatimonadales bacterium]